MQSCCRRNDRPPEPLGNAVYREQWITAAALLSKDSFMQTVAIVAKERLHQSPHSALHQFSNRVHPPSPSLTRTSLLDKSVPLPSCHEVSPAHNLKEYYILFHTLNNISLRKKKSAFVYSDQSGLLSRWTPRYWVYALVHTNDFGHIRKI